MNQPESKKVYRTEESIQELPLYTLVWTITICTRCDRHFKHIGMVDKDDFQTWKLVRICDENIVYVREGEEGFTEIFCRRCTRAYWSFKRIK